jgi:hypothetical protein
MKHVSDSFLNLVSEKWVVILSGTKQDTSLAQMFMQPVVQTTQVLVGWGHLLYVYCSAA